MHVTSFKFHAMTVTRLKTDEGWRKLVGVRLRRNRPQCLSERERRHCSGPFNALKSLMDKDKKEKDSKGKKRVKSQETQEMEGKDVRLTGGSSREPP